MRTEILSLIDLQALYELVRFFRKYIIEMYFALLKNPELKNLIQQLNDFYKNLDWNEDIKEFNNKTNICALANFFQKLNLAHTNFKLDKNPRNQLKFYHIILKILLEQLSSYHPTIAFLHYNIGLIHLELKENIALEHLEKSLSIYKQVVAENDKRIADGFSTLGLAYKIFNRPFNSLVHCKSALKIYLSLPSSSHIHLANTFLELANMYFEGEFCDSYLALNYLKNARHIFSLLGIYNKNIYNLESKINSLQKPSFIPRSPSIIVSHGKIDSRLIILKQKIQNSILKPITDAINIASPLIHPLYEINYLKKLLKDNAFLEPSLMLCFESINLAIMKSERKPFDLAVHFAKSHPEVIQKIATEHPEFFVDGSIVEACLKTLTYDIAPISRIK